MLVHKAEAAFLEGNNQGIANEYSAKLIWRIQTLRCALNILGQPCIRTQLEKQARNSEAEKVRAANFEKERKEKERERKEKERLKEAVTKLDKAVQEIEVQVRAVRKLLDIDMGQHLINWWHVLEKIFHDDKQVQECNCIPTKSNHKPAQDSNWKELMAAGLLPFILASPCEDGDKSHEQWLQHCLNSIDTDNPLCDINLSQILKRLNIVTPDNTIDSTAHDHFIYGWKDGVKDYIKEEDLTIAMLEWAVGAELCIDKHCKKNGVNIDFSTRQIMLGGIHDLFVALCKHKHNDKEDNSKLLESHIKMKCQPEENALSLLLSPLDKAPAALQTIINEDGVKKLFDSAANPTNNPSRSTKTATWGLLRSLGCDLANDSKRPKKTKDTTLILDYAHAYWMEEGLWISYKNPNRNEGTE